MFKKSLGVTTVGKPNFAELKPSDMFLVVEFKVNEESENDVSPHQLLVYTCSTDTKTIDSIIKSNHRFNLFYVLGRFDLYERMAKSRVTKTWKIDGKPVYCTEFTQVHKMNAYQIKNRVAGLPLDFVLKIEGATDESVSFNYFNCD